MAFELYVALIFRSSEGRVVWKVYVIKLPMGYPAHSERKTLSGSRIFEPAGSRISEPWGPLTKFITLVKA